MGREYAYAKPSVLYSPGADSVALGNSITITAALPKTFFDETAGRTVTINQNSIAGPLRVAKATGNNVVPITGAMADVVLTDIIGMVIRDSNQFFSQELLKAARTVKWDGAAMDSFRLKITVTPSIRGTFFLSLGTQGNKNVDCAVFKYSPIVANTDQHLYMISEINNGYIGEYSANYSYCFRVY